MKSFQAVITLHNVSDVVVAQSCLEAQKNCLYLIQ